MKRLWRRKLGTITWPPSPDALTEETEFISSLRIRTPYGDWNVAAGQLSIDRVIKYVGIQSIKLSTTVYHELIFYPMTPLNLTGYSGIHFWHGTNDQFSRPSMWGFALTDINDKWALLGPFGTVPNFWEEKNFEFTLFEVQEGFDWTQITEIRVWNMQPSVDTAEAWYDGFYFYGFVPDGTLRVESLPSGKSGTMTYGGATYPFTTPSEVTLPIGTEVIVNIDPTDFLNWEDGSTNPTRTESIVAGLKTIRATYSAAQLPMLTILSFDQNMASLPAQKGVKIVYAGIEEYIDVPFGARLSKGTYTLVPIDTSSRTFDHWKKPDGTTTTEKLLTFDLQANTQVEVHWKTAPQIPWEILAALGICFIAVGTILYLRG